MKYYGGDKYAEEDIENLYDEDDNYYVTLEDMKKKFNG